MSERSTASAIDADDDAGSDVWPATISLAPLRAELRRRWRLVAALSALGGFMGLALSVYLGGGSTATTTLFLARDGSQEPSSAMQTDIGLLTTRAVAVKVIDEQGLDVSATDLLGSISLSTPSTQLLTISVQADDPEAAVELTQNVADAFLDFRAELLTDQLEAANQGMEDQADQLAVRLDQVTAEIGRLAGSAVPEDQTRVNELISERSGLTTEISRLREGIQAEEVQVAAVIDSSKVVDPATVQPGGSLRLAVFSSASGFVGGGALGVAIVLAYGVLSDRPRRRSAVSAAIGSPVILSVDEVVGRRSSGTVACEQAAARLVDLIRVHRTPARSMRLALLSVASSAQTVAVAADLVRGLVRDGTEVTVVDLTEAGGLAKALRTDAVTVERWIDQARNRRAIDVAPSVVRPDRVPTLAKRPASLDEPWGLAVAERAASSPAGQVMLVVAEATPAVGADHIASWADNAVLVLRAGAASHDRLANSATVVRTAGISLLGAILTNTDRVDDSLGDPPESALHNELATYVTAISDR